MRTHLGRFLFGTGALVAFSQVSVGCPGGWLRQPSARAPPSTANRRVAQVRAAVRLRRGQTVPARIRSSGPDSWSATCMLCLWRQCVAGLDLLLAPGSRGHSALSQHDLVPGQSRGAAEEKRPHRSGAGVRGARSGRGRQQGSVCSGPGIPQLGASTEGRECAVAVIHLPPRRRGLVLRTLLILCGCAVPAPHGVNRTWARCGW